MYSEYIQDKKNFLEILLDYIDGEENIEEHYQKLADYLDDKKIRENLSELKIFFILLTKISNFHNRSTDFFTKIEKLILLFKNELSNCFSKSEILDIFRSNKRLLLFLFEENILIFDQSICNLISSENDTYYYFYPEIKSHFPNFEREKSISFSNKLQKYRFLNFLSISEENEHEQIIELLEKNPEDFNNKRKIGENDSYICQLIRNDDIDGFITYINKNNQSLKSFIPHSIFETNSFLTSSEEKPKKRYGIRTELIEYAAFFGSIQIFRYMFLNKVKLTNYVWCFAIHGGHPEIIQILEENVKLGDQPKKQFYSSIFNNENDDISYLTCFNLAVESFHNECAHYLLMNHINEEDLSHTYSSEVIKYFNFQYFQDDLQNDEVFCNLCKYGYFTMVDILTNKKSFDVMQIFEDKPLIFSIIDNNHYRIMKLLIEKNSFDINERFLFNEDDKKIKFVGLLHAAIKKENVEMVEFLLSLKDIDVNLCYIQLKRSYNANINTMLELANKFEKEDPQIFKGNDNLVIKTALHLAIKKRNFKIASLLLNKQNININIKTLKKIQVGTAYNDGDIIENRSIKKGISEPPILIALRNDSFDIAELLLSKQNIDVNSSSCYKYEYTFDYRDYSRKRYTELQAHNKASEYKTVLYTAIEKESTKIVQLLLNSPEIDINAPSTIIANQDKLEHYMDNLLSMNPEIAYSSVKAVEEKRTPLKIAITKENHDILKVLLEQPNIVIDSYGDEALACVVKNGFTDIYDALLSRPDFNAKDGFKGALHKAINSRNA